MFTKSQKVLSFFLDFIVVWSFIMQWRELVPFIRNVQRHNSRCTNEEAFVDTNANITVSTVLFFVFFYLFHKEYVLIYIIKQTRTKHLLSHLPQLGAKYIAIISVFSYTLLHMEVKLNDHYKI